MIDCTVCCGLAVPWLSIVAELPPPTPCSPVSLRGQCWHMSRLGQHVEQLSQTCTMYEDRAA